MATASITSNEGALDSASAVLEVTATNPAYNQPALRIKQVSGHGGAASIRIDDPNPDIEFVETDQVAPAGKYEIAVQSDKLQINGRNANDTAFETIVVFQRRPARCLDRIAKRHDGNRYRVTDVERVAQLGWGFHPDADQAVVTETAGCSGQ